MSKGLVALTGAEYFGSISVAMVTPFNENGELDLGAAAKLARHLVDNGVDSLVLSGTTGEAPTTTLTEKIDLLTAVREEIGAAARIIAGAGTNNTRSTVEASKACADAGADGLLIVTPYYSKPSQEGIYQHFSTVAKATELPICVYDIPGRTGVAIEAHTLSRIAELPTVAAVKDAKGNIALSTALIDALNLAWYSGDDPLNLPWLSVGAVGFISVIGHLAPRQLREMYENFNNGNLAKAREINASLAPLVRAQARLGGVAFAKAGLRLQGIDVGEPRLPNLAPSVEEYEALSHDMKIAGVLTNE
ncbi:4-hydroxy-tetrahydrodipicolinate synthase [Corynebacterium sp. ES2775-CONJ]|uniref:4-hydroxy-tetrahydrodipicolinate synthase n=1 Tax=Corynebacterium sp. ES2775-CONJ TaxID=2974029 RepID=UPI002168D6B3|nr:4-hydroxy-tetrahydrodipicolinate synthase [Corynebacterium sp. ES2775-CONJ]MCS4489141.1 4-hydroxy-tetrahydrodipicolinate synthase [Corynebacterium sp. ES2775-CONJ]